MSEVPLTKPYAMRLKKALQNIDLSGDPAADRFSCNPPQKGVSGPLARPAKRHYTFARRRLDLTSLSATNTAPHANKALIFRLFCSLRLSVRTPPFHGGESGSIPLGSATRLASI
jgi:hypothetical protein